MKILFNLFVLLLISNLCYTQYSFEVESTIAKTMCAAHCNNSKFLWVEAIDQINCFYEDTENEEAKLLLAYAHYGMAGTAIGNRDADLGKKAIENGIKYAEALSSHDKYGAEALSINAGLLGIQIGFSPMKGMTLGPKSDKLVVKAMKVDDQCAMSYLQEASSLYNTPRMFGGSVSKSIDAFKKAVRLYDKMDQSNNWLRLEALCWLGQAYHKSDQLEEAKSTYELVLAEAPNHGWVKNLLLPQLLKDMD